MSSGWEDGNGEAYGQLFGDDGEWDFDALDEGDLDWAIFDEPNDLAANSAASQPEPQSLILSPPPNFTRDLHRSRATRPPARPTRGIPRTSPPHHTSSATTANTGEAISRSRHNNTATGGQLGRDSERSRHSEDWLDFATTARRSSSLSSISPEDLWRTSARASPPRRSTHGFHIDDILNSDGANDMPPTTRRRQNGHSVVDLTNEAPTPPAVGERRGSHGMKRSAPSSSEERESKRTKRSVIESKVKPEVEELDLTNEAPSAEEELLQAQQEQAIKAQQAEEEDNSPQRIGKRQCIICMESFTNATITHCGHIYCHECLTQALLAGEKNDRGTGNCPVCRKVVSRKKAHHVIPINFMKKSAFKDKARRDLSLLA